ncbi:hypothetical protein [Lysinibacillus parviboronicapiens]|nr:hypothetical protein [Lysinibacillus parviboronicapiens]
MPPPVFLPVSGDEMKKFPLIEVSLYPALTVRKMPYKGNQLTVKA